MSECWQCQSILCCQRWSCRWCGIGGEDCGFCQKKEYLFLTEPAPPPLLPRLRTEASLAALTRGTGNVHEPSLAQTLSANCRPKISQTVSAELAMRERSPSFARCFSPKTHDRTSLYRLLMWSDSCCLAVFWRHMVCLPVANKEGSMFTTTLDAVKAQKWREENTRPECVFRYFSKAAARSRSRKATATRSPQGRCLAVCNTSPALCRRRRSWRSSVIPV